MNLADRYRRLLRWYPRDHRERHGEEMLGVLLAGAGERTRPTRAETADLLRGALRLHARRVAGAGVDHRDVFAIVSLLGPLMMLAGAAPVLDRLAAWVRVGSRTMASPDAPFWAVWFVVAVLTLFRMRRSAAVGAWIGSFGLLPGPLLGRASFYDEVLVNAGWLLLGVLVAAALTFSPGPDRGGELVPGRRVVLLAAAVAVGVVLVVGSLGTYNVLHHGTGGVRMVIWCVALAVLVAGALVAAGPRTREGRRAALVLAVPVVVTLLMLVMPRSADFVVGAVVCYGVPVVVLVVLGGLPRRTGGMA
ncbi:hypothetical protein [Actinophytocola sp. KF-1]